ncbi:MAG: membrane protein insertion efficiency factor YidD [Verrucomicrobiae bacterium]
MIPLFIFLIRIYQRVLSPALQAVCGPGCGCRFEPTCSEYFIQALRGHGFFNGLGLGIGRIARCHPWGGCGYDPVPSAWKTLN